MPAIRKSLRYSTLVSLLIIGVFLAACTSAKMAGDNKVTLSPVSHGIYHLEGLNAGEGLIWSPDGKYLAGLILPILPMPDGCSPLPILCILFPPSNDPPFSEIFLVRTDTWQRQTIIKIEYSQKRISSISWFPDSRHIIYDTTSYPNTGGVISQLRSIGIDGRNDVLFMNDDKNHVWNLIWSPDGSKIASVGAIQESANWQSVIYILNATNHEKDLIFEGKEQFSSVRSLSWSADGKKIAFSYGQIGSTIPAALRPQIFLSALDTNKTTRLTNDQFEYWSGEFSPVHNLIALQRVDATAANSIPEYKTVIEDLDRYCQIELPIADSNLASWSPDGQKLVVTSLYDAYLINLSEYIGPAFAEKGSICG